MLQPPNLGAGIVVRSPERPEPGYWVGCPSILRQGGRFWLTYRERRPRGTGDDRGWRGGIAVSEDGIRFDDVWAVRKGELETASMERFALIDSSAGFTLFVSYVDPADNRWRIDAVDAATPDAFDIATRRPVLTAASTSTEGVKDPVIARANGVDHLFASYAAARPGLAVDAHATADIYNVGATTHPTGRATRAADGASGDAFRWQGEALGVGRSWDRYQARLGSIVPFEDGWIGTYDGSASHEENYEERTGLAASADLAHWTSRTPDAPWIVGPGPTASVRYIDMERIDDAWWIWAEVTRTDGAHELRVVPG